jgi:hypothetical protein
VPQPRQYRSTPAAKLLPISLVRWRVQDTFLWSCDNVILDKGPPHECSSAVFDENATTFVRCPGGVPPPLMVVGETVSYRMLQLLCTEHCE